MNRPPQTALFRYLQTVEAHVEFLKLHFDNFVDGGDKAGAVSMKTVWDAAEGLIHLLTEGSGDDPPPLPRGLALIQIYEFLAEGRDH